MQGHSNKPQSERAGTVSLILLLCSKPYRQKVLQYSEGPCPYAHWQRTPPLVSTALSTLYSAGIANVRWDTRSQFSITVLVEGKVA